MPSTLQLYYITDRTQIRDGSLEDCIQKAIDGGVDWVQIREKDLSARSLLTLAQSALDYACKRDPAHTRVIINDRLDVAWAAKAHGVHLGTRSMPAGKARSMAPAGFLLGISCHSLEEALAAQAAGADYILLGPVFETPSKVQYGPPLGLCKLREVTLQVSLPVFALGGINIERISQCLENGAAGIAGIRIFQECESLPALVRILRI